MKVTCNIRIDSEVKVMLEELAKKEGRSLTNTIEWLIKREHKAVKGEKWQIEDTV